MESTWFIILVTLSICAALKALVNLIQSSTNRRKVLPPGPLSIPILTTLQWLLRRKSIADLLPILRNLGSKYGPIFTLQIGGRKSIFITSHTLAHQALIQHGAAIADRPLPRETSKFLSSNQHNINSASYGPLWRLFRRNLTSQILHPSKIKSYSPDRKWVLELLKKKLETQSKSGQLPVRVIDPIKYAMFSLLVFMCFGEKLDEKSIREIESVETALHPVLLSSNPFNILNLFPKLGKILFKSRWRELYQLRSNQENVLIPLIKSRQENLKLQQKEENKFVVVAYVDTLLHLNLPDEGGRRLNEHEIVTLCSEFLNGGTDSTSTALQWIMANLVRNQRIQLKLADEIKRVVKQVDDDEYIKEEDLQNVPYLKAVVLEGLRLHPPGHLVVPHAVTDDIFLDGYVIPKDAMVNFMVAEIGRDPTLWEDPMEFRPERFLTSGEAFDITGSREIKMMPFGTGRRICPGLGLAMLHLEYFVANLVKEFEWTARVGDDVDLSEKQELTTTMKNPLWVNISQRI